MFTTRNPRRGVPLDARPKEINEAVTGGNGRVLGKRSSPGFRKSTPQQIRGKEKEYHAEGIKGRPRPRRLAKWTVTYKKIK